MITPTEHEFALKLLDDTRDGVMRMLNGACLGSHTNRAWNRNPQSCSGLTSGHGVIVAHHTVFPLG